MAHRKGLKQKDIERITVLTFKHPAEITVEEQEELVNLQERLNKYGHFEK